MKRVLFVDHVDRILGGAEVNLIELLEEAQRAGEWEVSVACGARSSLGKATARLGIRQFEYGFGEALNTLRFAAQGFPWARVWQGWRALKKGAEALRKIAAAAPPDFVISCTNKDHFAAARIENEGCRRIWWVNDLISRQFFSRPTLAAFRHHSVRADRMVAVSHCVREALVKLGVRKELVDTIHNGIPLPKYQGAEKSRFRRSFGIPLDQPLIGMVGRICPWKGQDKFLHIAENWIQAGLAGNFVVVGDAFNEDADYARSLKRSDELSRRVHFIPFQEDIGSVLVDLDVLLHTSLKPEPFGRVLIEAMASGAAVIAADSGGVPEVIRDGETGFLANPGDHQDYVRCLRLVMMDEGLRRRMSVAAQQAVAESFTIQRVYADFDRLMAGLT